MNWSWLRLVAAPAKQVLAARRLAGMLLQSPAEAHVAIDRDDEERNAPQTESARERGFTVDRDQQDFGVAAEDPDSAGDIADEGAGHRDVNEAAPRLTPGPAESPRDRRDEQSGEVRRVADSDRH